MASVVVAGLVPQALAAPAVAAERAGHAAPKEGRAGGGAEAGDLVSEETALQRAAATGKKVEVTTARTESGEVYATPGGDLESVEHLRPVRTRADGRWQPVDTTLRSAPSGRLSPRGATVGLEFSGGGQGPAVRLERAGRALSLGWPTPLPEPRLEGDTAVYQNVMPDVDLRLSAQPDGFSQLLVVKSAKAAASDELAALRLHIDTNGVTVRETGHGGVEAVDPAADSAVFEAAGPMMWDSSTAVSQAGGGSDTDRKSTGGEREAPRSAEAAGADPPGMGDSGKLAPVGVDIAAHGKELVLTPDQRMLTDESTVYPVYIDPQWFTPRASAWTVASRYWASSPQWKFNGDADAGLGFCGWAYCKPSDTKRLFYQIPTAKFAGKHILSAEFVVRETHAASCEPRGVQLWRTQAISPSTTWNSSDDASFWVDHLTTKSFAHGFEGCAAADAEFDALGVVRQAAERSWPTTTFGLRAADEGDKYGWKRFADDAYLRVRYNRPPAQLKMAQLTMDPGGTCQRADRKPFVRSLPTVRASRVTDPDGDAVSVQFQASWDSGDGKGWKPRWTSARSTQKRSGSDFSIKLPSSVPQERIVEWHARAWDGAQWSPWSYEGSATGCNFTLDNKVPAGPAITSAEYPPSVSGDADEPWQDGVGRYGTFNIDSSSSDVTRYWLGINESQSAKHTLTTSGGVARSTRFMPTAPGVNFVVAQAFDAAGNASEPRTYYFRVRAGQPERMVWDLDEGADAASVSGAGGSWPATLAGGAAPGGTGVMDGALRLDGADDHAATVSPVLNTGKSFSVSVWAKLPEEPREKPAVVISQGGNNTSGFEIYYSYSAGGWALTRHTSDASSGAGFVRAAQPPCPTGDSACGKARLGTWTHLTGVYDRPNERLSLYVNGALVGSNAYTQPWDARGRTLLGAVSLYGTVENHFKGEVDQAELFDYPLNAAQVTGLHDKKQVTTQGRPAKVVWPLDEVAGASTVDGRGQQVAGTLDGGARAGAPGVKNTALALDGVDDHIRARQPVLDTYQSFAVSLWAKVPADKENRSMTAAAQGGSHQRGFELYHSSGLGGWVFLRGVSDSPEASTVRVSQRACPDTTPNCPAARLGEWAHVVGVYDLDDRTTRLYVNGKLEATEDFTTPWAASGPLTIGAVDYPTGSGSFLKGAVDEVRLYDRAISGDEVRQLFKQRPLVKGRWKLDAVTGSPASTPDDSTTRRPMTLYNGARTEAGWVDAGGLALDGVDDYAATAGSPIDSSASFTVSGWAQAAAKPTRPATLISADGSRHSAFAVRYVPDKTKPDGLGRWRITLPDEDTDQATESVVESGQFNHVSEWNHLAVVYDGFAGRLSLYVNGQLEEAVCADADADGAADDSTCASRVSWAENAIAFNGNKTLQLGRSKSAGTFGEYWPGAVDDVWAFQGALTDTQIEYLASGWPGAPTQVPSP
ncbi:LamG domain-containing protein [Streptomyces buecherae]|uniref:LamG domain-containing protein n=1 Tax=Streptomyces buecherae TaxID=2763006 RepID=UPI001C273503|nr:LamG domain-containing protein [Streptomyces buecherae]